MRANAHGERCDASVWSKVVASVGASTAVGRHLDDVAAGWAARGGGSAAQLRKVNMGNDECLEVQELLLELAGKYEESLDL